MSEPWQRSPTFAVAFGGGLIGTVNLEVDAQSQSAIGRNGELIDEVVYALNL
jgi:hypothetical protein